MFEKSEGRGVKRERRDIVSLYKYVQVFFSSVELCSPECMNYLFNIGEKKREKTQEELRERMPNAHLNIFI